VSSTPGGAAGAPDILRRIAERRRERLADHRRHHPADVAAAAAVEEAAPPADTLTEHDNRFLAALARPRGRGRPGLDVAPAPAAPLATPATPALAAIPAIPATPAIIAEVKMGSPRLGTLHGRVDPLAQARCYAENGAAALSVVVEPDFFHGDYGLLAACGAACGLPAIAKDFVVDPLQLVWARRAGADAVLLIAALYSPEELARYAWMARGLGLVPLIETHDAADLALLAGEPWELVGINNRDLRTFAVDLERSIALLPSLPRGALRVAESGIRDALDVALLADSGFDALLIGESLLLAADPAAALRALLGTGPAVPAAAGGSAG
jgi:indole-3-glycerol phosphate synthase